MHPRLAEAKKVEAMEQSVQRLERIEAKLDRLLALHDTPTPKPEAAPQRPSQPARR